jgi:hypothetical protein
LPHLTRIGIGVVLSELPFFKQVHWKKCLSEWFLWAGALFLSAFMLQAVQSSGLTDLSMSLLDPKMHPSVIVIFCFMTGLLLGMVTGNFFVAFFPLFISILKSSPTPLVQAALLDGVLAGTFLCPYSLWNIVCAVQYGIAPEKILRYRYRQLGFPIAMGGIIYAISAINSVNILRPTAFVFLCLVAVAVQLKRGAWRFGKYMLLPDSHSGVH